MVIGAVDDAVNCQGRHKDDKTSEVDTPRGDVRLHLPAMWHRKKISYKGSRSRGRDGRRRLNTALTASPPGSTFPFFTSLTTHLASPSAKDDAENATTRGSSNSALDNWINQTIRESVALRCASHAVRTSPTRIVWRGKADSRMQLASHLWWCAKWDSSSAGPSPRTISIVATSPQFRAFCRDTHVADGSRGRAEQWRHGED